jgi:pilus assembly protein FimV
MSLSPYLLDAIVISGLQAQLSSEPHFVFGDALKTKLHRPGRTVLRQTAAAAAMVGALLIGAEAWALGLGRLNVQSALGEALRAEIDVTSITAEEASNFSARVASSDAYRAAGVEYNPVLQNTTVTLRRRADGSQYLQLTSDRPVQEPFVDVILDLNWSSGRLVREYTMLFDPPTTPRAPATAQTAPAITPAPRAQAPASAPAPAPVAAAPSAAAPAPAPRPSATRPAPAPAAAAPRPAAAPGDVRVRSGDTLSGIARRTQPTGVSLDQMLVGLYRTNPNAFISNNMNLLKSGSVLKVPSADDAKAIAPGEARQVIQAQSADFATYRQRLAGAVPAAPAAPAQREATGKVQAEVQDRKQAAAPSTDKLTLDKGRVAAGTPAAEDKVAREREQRDVNNRAGELARNVEELKKLQAASSAAAAGGAAAKAPAAQPAPAAAGPKVAIAPPVVPSAPVRAPAASAPTVAATPAPAPVVAPAPAPAPAPVAVQPASAPIVAAAASAPAVAASVAAPVVAMASAPEITPAASAAVPAPRVAAASAPVTPPPALEEPGFIASLSENPTMLLGAGGLVALLAGVGLWRLRSKKKSDGGETSFLESRLQPDSFFGASGGQRIDTRDPAGAPSSMSYSLSQLDAIGDVDPVAEADVYLAYGRDLQAEEILKEAMRATPDRLAIRSKLLEVYAKRRDTKGFELLATQLYGLTSGQGEDWTKAQELGRSIDPENPLYRPGGQPAASAMAAAAAKDMMGVSTMPQSVVPSPSRFETSTPGAADTDIGAPNSASGIDLDLSGPEEPAAAAPAPAPIFERMSASPAVSKVTAAGAAAAAAATAAAKPAMEFDLPDLPTVPRDPVSSKAEGGGNTGFDLGGLSLDLDDGSSAKNAGLPSLQSVDLPGDLSGADANDPLVRKLELAEEFRQIGDTEGARDLLQEVAERASGALKAKAQSMLDSLV